MLFHPLQHLRQLPLVVTVLSDLGGHDDLSGAVHCDLRIVRLHEAPFAPAIRHDPAFRIGEVALRRWLRPGLFRVRYLWWTPAELLAARLLLLQPIFKFR